MKTPFYLIDEAALERNLRTIAAIRDAAGVKILLAQKAYSVWQTYPLVAKYLDGTTASGEYELRLAAEEMPDREKHVFSPAFTEATFRAVTKHCDHIVFNSPRQVGLFAARAMRRGIRTALRVNIGYSEIKTALYNPCSPRSRLGTPLEFVTGDPIGQVDGLHFHAMCEQGADVFERTLAVFERKFSRFFGGIAWVNFGGGNYLTERGYDRKRLIRTLREFRRRWPHLEVYLEPGEAVAYNAGTLLTTVLEANDWGHPFAILDASAECHMPDVLEMPYRPPLKGSGMPGEKRFTYRLGGPTCLAGDIIGDYSFDRPLEAGDVLEFGNMAVYSIVKNNHFNGMPLPGIVLRKKSGKLTTLRAFGYGDFKERLGRKGK